MGVGELKMDLRGTPKHDYNVDIRGGVGEATVHLPRDIGVYATGSGGIGEIHLKGGDRVWLSPDPARLHRFDKDGMAIRQ